MYLGTLSITRLYMLLTGYSIARMEQNLNKTEEEFIWVAFQQWIQDKYNVLSSKSWATIILENSTDERGASHFLILMFFVLCQGHTNLCKNVVSLAR